MLKSDSRHYQSIVAVPVKEKLQSLEERIYQESIRIADLTGFENFFLTLSLEGHFRSERFFSVGVHSPTPNSAENNLSVSEFDPGLNVFANGQIPFAFDSFFQGLDTLSARTLALSVQRSYRLNLNCLLAFYNSTNIELTPLQFEVIQGLHKLIGYELSLAEKDILREEEVFELRNRDQAFEQLIEATQVALWDWNVQTGELVISERWASMVGYTLDELSPISIDTWYKIVHPDDREDSDRALKQCFEGKAKYYDITCRLIHKSGVEIWINDRGKVVEWSADNKPLRMIGVHTDITERRAKELQFKIITENLPGVVFCYQRFPDGRDGLQFVSEGAKSLWGISSEEAMADNAQVWAGYDPRDLDSHLKSIDDSAKNLDLWQHEWRYIHPTLGTRWHRGVGSPRKQADGSIIWYSYILDVTEEITYRNMLEESENRLKSVLSNVSNIAIQGFDDKQRVILWNSASERMYGYDEEEALGRTIDELILPERLRGIIHTAMESLLDGHDQFPSSEFEFKRKDGKALSVYTCFVRIQLSEQPPELYKLDIDLTEFKEIHSALQKTDNELRRVLDMTLDLVCALDANGNFTTVNGAALSRILGYSVDEFIGHNYSEFVHSEEVEHTYKMGEMIAQGQSVTNFINTYVRKDGGLVKLSWSAKWDESESLMFCVARDATEMVEAEAKLLHSQSLLNEAQRLARMGSWNFDFRSDALLWSDPLYDVFDVDREMFIETHGSFIDLVHPDDRERVRNTSTHAQKTGDHFKIEYRIITPKGEERIIEEFGYSEKDAHGNILRLFGTAQDITQRKQAEEQVRLANYRFEKVTQATKDAIWDWNLVEKTVFWGQGYLTNFGYDPLKNPPSIEDWEVRIHESDRKRIWDSLEIAISEPSIMQWKEEYRFRKEDGEFAYVSDRAVFIRDTSGRVMRMVGAMSDITFQKQYEESLRKLNESLEVHARNLAVSNAELEQFAFVASHDLQEPLRMVTSFLTQLETKYGNQLDEKAHKYIHFAVDGAKRMRRIILDLLDYSRVGKNASIPEQVNMNQVMEDVILLQRKLIQEKNALVKYDSLPVVLGHKAQLIQVLHNLINNALKYVESGLAPVISVSSYSDESFWYFKVSDNGIGVQEEYFDKIFVVFQRLHGQDQFEGSGMGLAIVKKIVESAGGRIWLESSIGRGSVFYFSIPKLKRDEIDVN